MPIINPRGRSGSVSQNQKAQLANAYNELGKELSSSKIRVVGNYTLGKVIGQGAYGKVRMGTHRLTSTRVAIKQIPKAMSASLTREIHHHRQLHHPHVTQMYEVIATESHIWIVTELCSGGELFDYLVEKGRLAEDETKILFGQLCLAVNYLHEKGIVHRDLKLENVLLDERCRVKLGDFGFTREFEKGQYMETFCGTTGYAAPEMLQGRRYQGPEVDVWSLGVILYTLLTGTLPFDDDDDDVMRNKVILGEFDDPEWLSDDARDLFKSILQRDSVRRITIPQILDHPWFKYRSSPIASESLTTSPLEANNSSLSITHEAFTSSEVAPTTQSSEISHSSASSDSPSLSSAPTTPGDIANDPFHNPHPNTSSATSQPDLEEDVFGSWPISGSSKGVKSAAASFQPPLTNKELPRNPSEATIRRVSLRLETPNPTTPNAIIEEEADGSSRVPPPPPVKDHRKTRSSSPPLPPIPIVTPSHARADSGGTSSIRKASGSSGSLPPPPIYPIRTPARTKRRSVSTIDGNDADGDDEDDDLVNVHGRVGFGGVGPISGLTSIPGLSAPAAGRARSGSQSNSATAAMTAREKAPFGQPSQTQTQGRSSRGRSGSVSNNNNGSSNNNSNIDLPPSISPKPSAPQTPRPPSRSQLSKIEPADPSVLIDFHSLLATPAPIIFSTSLERDLLNSLSSLGFDAAQTVHSVLSDACDAAGALWWMLKKKAERRLLDEVQAAAAAAAAAATATHHNSNASTTNVSSAPSPITGATPTAPNALPATSSSNTATSSSGKHHHHHHHHHHRAHRAHAGVQTDLTITAPLSPEAKAAAQRGAPPTLSFVPPTPTIPRGHTPPPPLHPPRSGSPANAAAGVGKSMLSPTSSFIALAMGNKDKDKDKDKDREREREREASGDGSSGGSGLTSVKSHPGTPSGSVKDKDRSGGGGGGGGGRKPRSGSISIMQRATTALEAAGLVRKKSTEAVKEKEKEERREKEREGKEKREKEREREKEKEKEESRSSYGSTSSAGNQSSTHQGSDQAKSGKMTKSPPLKPAKDHGYIPTLHGSMLGSSSSGALNAAGVSSSTITSLTSSSHATASSSTRPGSPSTPPITEQNRQHRDLSGSPWVFADLPDAPASLTNRPSSSHQQQQQQLQPPSSNASATSGSLGIGEGRALLLAAIAPAGADLSASMSAPNLTLPGSEPTPPAPTMMSGTASAGRATGVAPVPTAPRNRANILTAFRMWLSEDRRGKRKGGDGTASGSDVEQSRERDQKAREREEQKQRKAAAATTAAQGKNRTGRRVAYLGGGNSAKRRGSNSSIKYVPANIVVNNGGGNGGGGSGPNLMVVGAASAAAAAAAMGMQTPNGAHRTQRPPASSRRSSSINSRRSSGASIHISALDASPAGALGGAGNRRSYGGGGAHTPNSERGDIPSRPSSIRSFSMGSSSGIVMGGNNGNGKGRHKKSPSTGSGGSAGPRYSSPIASKYHRRAGSSGSSTTRVIRTHSGGTGSGSRTSHNGVHIRSNSAASSLHSPASSRPASYYEFSEGEGLSMIPQGVESAAHSRNASPFRTTRIRRNYSGENEMTPRRHNSGGSSSSGAIFLAHKKNGLFASPNAYYGYAHNSIGRSSWKKSWGMEPPGWSTRAAAPFPVEVLAISSTTGTGDVIRDVFSGSTSKISLDTAGMGDESDWVDDEDDEDFPFAGGLGQTGFGSMGGGGSGGGGGGSGVGMGGLGTAVVSSILPASAPSIASMAGLGIGGAGAGAVDIFGSLKESSRESASHNRSSSLSASTSTSTSATSGAASAVSSSAAGKRSSLLAGGASGTTGGGAISAGGGRKHGGLGLVNSGLGSAAPGRVSPVSASSSLDGAGVYEANEGMTRRGTRSGRSGPAFRQAIQEEDEEEEEE